jgi:hypothetical protein
MSDIDIGKRKIKKNRKSQRSACMFCPSTVLECPATVVLHRYIFVHLSGNGHNGAFENRRLDLFISVMTLFQQVTKASTRTTTSPSSHWLSPVKLFVSR